MVFAGGLTGTYVTVDLAYAAFVLGVPTYYAARILQDLRSQQKALQERTQQLVEAGQQKSQFMANMTHELGTPIHGICGLSDPMESGIYGPVTGKQKDAQQSIKRCARSLLALIDDLLELSRADAGKLDCASSRSTWLSWWRRWWRRALDGRDEGAVGGDRRGRRTCPTVQQRSAGAEAGAPESPVERGQVHAGGRAHPSSGAAGRAHGGGRASRFRTPASASRRRHQARIFEEFRQVDGSAGAAIRRRGPGAGGGAGGSPRPWARKSRIASEGASKGPSGPARPLECSRAGSRAAEWLQAEGHQGVRSARGGAGRPRRARWSCPGGPLGPTSRYVTVSRWRSPGRCCDDGIHSTPLLHVELDVQEGPGC